MQNRASKLPATAFLGHPSAASTAALICSPSKGRSCSPNRSLATVATHRGCFMETGLQKGTANILIAEDDEPIRALITQILKGAGYKTTSVADGLAAWKALIGGGYDLFITDNDMPVLTGVQLVAKLRLNRVKLPIILASGSADLFSSEEYRWLDFSACLRKPFAPDELLKTVARILQADPTS